MLASFRLKWIDVNAEKVKTYYLSTNQQVFWFDISVYHMLAMAIDESPRQRRNILSQSNQHIRM